MRVDLFDFDLPEDRIALRPVAPRDAARLLVVGPDGGLEDRVVRELPDLLRPGDVLVLNDTRVVPARLSGRRIGRGEFEPRIEATLIERLDGERWRAFVRPARRLQAGDLVRFGGEGEVCFFDLLDAHVENAPSDGEATLAFSLTGAALDAAIAARGRMPLPPYIASRRPPDERDARDYQTLYAAHDGAVAAPTAGLHVTPELLQRLDAAGSGSAFMTLHVGPGTFLPVKAEETDEHRMHAEWGRVDTEVAARLNAARGAGGRIVAVGTTALRLLESAAGEDGAIHAFEGETRLFITPGFRFRAVDLLMTNFHLSRSTLFMLVAAFSGLETMKRAYAHAIAAGYRFYSYGDACLLHPGAAP
jgi:S-adenosylmethionine:tRNA ribosyltransferase-isomerase